MRQFLRYKNPNNINENQLILLGEPPFVGML